jgi:competence protein ComEA
MLKKLWVALLVLVAATAFAAVDVNKATQAELESIKGIGPAISGKILDERKKAPFKDWNDVIERVKGVGGHGATRFSSGGLTVDGAAYTGAAASKAGAKSRKKADGKSAAAAAAAGARKK